VYRLSPSKATLAGPDWSSSLVDGGAAESELAQAGLASYHRALRACHKISFWNVFR
jgi:hypothetical protein